jgi:hypothetical protein
MSKKHRKFPARDENHPSRGSREGGKAAIQPPPDFTEGRNPKKSRLFWIPALILVISGYVLLNKVEPGGRNVWAVISPALLLAGYLLFVPAILSRYPRKD